MNRKISLTVKDKIPAVMVKHKIVLLTAAAFLFLGILLGQKLNSGKHSEDEVHAGITAQDEKNRHEGHGHGGNQTQGDGEYAANNPDEMQKMMCEHDISIVDCNNCRFEVGLVRIDKSIDSLIETGSVEDMERAIILNLTGQVQLDRTRTVDVVSTCGGRVDHVSKLLGEKVEPSDLLAVIRSADLGQAKADFLEFQSKLELTQATFKREKELYEKKITSHADYLNALNELKTAEASYSAADKRLRLFGLETEQISAIKDEKDNGDFANLILRAPQGGTIIAQNISAGKMVETTESLYTIADLSNLWVWCDVYEKDLAIMHEQSAKGNSLKAIVRVKAYEPSVFTGVIDFVGDLMDEHTRTVKMRVQVKNPGNKLKPGMFADVEVAIPLPERIAAVPNVAVMSDAGKNFVFQLWKNDLWIRRDVVTGDKYGDFVEIMSGIPKGATIVTGGAFMLKSDILREKMGAGCAD